MPLKIFIVEDHLIMRQMLIELLKKRSGFEVCGTAATGAEALEGLAEAGADLVLVDVSLPEMNGIDLVQELLSRWPELHCLMLSGHGEATYVQRSLEAGARGYVLKGNPSEITGAIEVVAGGDPYLSDPLWA